VLFALAMQHICPLIAHALAKVLMRMSAALDEALLA